MENDRGSRKKNEDEALTSQDDENESLYVTASEQPAQITINLDKDDTKRKITIISEVESPKRPRRPSADLRRQAMVNNARRRSQSTASSRSRSRSRGRSRSRSRRASAPRRPSVTPKSPSKAELLAQIGGKSYSQTDSKSAEKVETPKRTPKKTPKKTTPRSSRTRSKSLSRSRSRSRSGSRSRLRGRSVPRRSANNGNRTTSHSRPLSKSRPVPPPSIQKQMMKKSKEDDNERSPTKYPPSPHPVAIRELTVPKPTETTPKPSLRLPTHLCKRTIVGRNGLAPPEFIQLPSPLFILTEQQTIGASEKKTVQFVTKILLTSHKLSEEERKKLYAEMVEAEYVGTSRSSTDLSKASDGEPEEDFQLKTYYSARGIYIHSVQNVRKTRDGKRSRIEEEKSYSNICKTKIVGELGKSTEGLLNVSCSETVSVENQNYTRSEHFKIGFKNANVIGDSIIHAVKTTFDPTKTTSFEEEIKFDSKNIGIHIFHTSTAAMETMWNHEMGSFGEEQSEYREVRFFFDDGKGNKGQTPNAVPPPPPAPTQILVAPPTPSARTPKPSSNTTGSSSSSASETSARRSRSRSKRHKAIAKKNSLSNKISNVSKSPDRQSSKKSTRPDEEPITGSGIKDSLNSTSKHSSFYHSFPEATSTPKSPMNLTNSSILQSNAKLQTTPDKSPLRRGAISIREHSEKHSDNEIDLDKSLSLKKPTASKNLAQMVESKKKEEPRQQEVTGSMISGKPPTSPGNSVYLYQTGSTNNSTYMTAKDLHDARVSAASSKTSTSPQGTRRVKETKVTREVREENGKPAEINEKKEETVKEEKVKLGKRSRSVSPATPNMKRPLDRSMVTLSAVKETHQTLEMTPIKVSDDSAPTQSSSVNSGQRAFREEVQMDLLIDKKRLVLNVNFMLLAEKQPEVEITGFCFKGQKLWEKSSEWNLSSANTTSHTKTVARQASDILGDGKEEKN